MLPQLMTGQLATLIHTHVQASAGAKARVGRARVTGPLVIVESGISTLRARSAITGSRARSAGAIIKLPKPSSSSGWQVNVSGTVVVLTPMNLEYKAMRAQLAQFQRIRHPEGTIFEVGKLPGTPWRVALLVTGEGNNTAAVLAERAISWFQPEALLVVGVAGGLKDDIELGDVVVATWVHGYHGGKEDAGGFRARPRGWAGTHLLEQAARHVEADGRWTQRLPAQPGPRSTSSRSLQARSSSTPRTPRSRAS